MPCERQLQRAFGKVPELDSPVGGARHKELVHGIDGNTSHPSCMSADDPSQLPRRMPLLFLLALTPQRDLILVGFDGGNE